MKTFNNRNPAFLSALSASSGSTLVTSGLIAQWESDGITGLVNNDPVATWPDQSGNALDATQANSAIRPTYKTNQFGTKPGVSFDGYAGSNRNLGFTGSNIISSGFTFFIALNFVSAVSGTYSGPFSWNAGSNNRFIYANAGGTTNNAPNMVLRSSGGGEFYTKAAAPAVAFGKSLEIWTWNGTVATARINGVDKTLNNGLSGMDNGAPYGLGVSTFWGCASVIAAVLMYNRVLSGAEILSNESYLNGKYGIY